MGCKQQSEKLTVQGWLLFKTTISIQLYINAEKEKKLDDVDERKYF